jgi:hypothetical protein
MVARLSAVMGRAQGNEPPPESATRPGHQAAAGRTPPRGRYPLHICFKAARLAGRAQGRSKVSR